MKKIYESGKGRCPIPQKLLLVMKLTAFLIVVLTMQVTATVYSQNKKLSLNMQGNSIKEVLQQIEAQSEYRFIYENEKVNLDTKVSIKVKDEVVENILKKLFEKDGVSYSITDNNLILINPSDGQLKNLGKESINSQQQKNISGKVTDSSGASLPGVSVVVKGTTNGLITDMDGKYSLSKVPENSTLVFSFVGMKTQEIAIGNKTTINVTLTEETVGIEEVVAVGYGTQNKKTVIGSMSSVKANDLQTVNAISIDNLLQGKASGVSITQRSAQPGSGLSITIRGALSPRGSNEPLYVIDGVPLTTVGAANSSKTGAGINNFIDGVDRSPLSTLNPNDIQSIDILKDASATAIYGSSAANGVILITTKRGLSGKPTVSFSSSFATQEISKQPEVLGAKEFMNLSNTGIKERWLYSKKYAPYGLTPAPSSGWGQNFTQAEIDAATNYNHQDAIYRNGAIYDNNLSISGGNENTKYFVAFNYLDQKSLLKTTDLKRYSGRINLDQTFNKWLKLSLNSFYSETESNNPSVGGSRTVHNEARQTQAAMFFSPRIPLENPDGSLNVSDLVKVPNPAAWLYMKDQSVNKRIFVSPNLQFKLTSDFSANIVAGYDNTTSAREIFSPTKSRLPEQTANNFAGFSNNENRNLSLETYVTYNKQITENHRISVVAGTGYYKASGVSHGLSVFNLPTDATENYNISLAPQGDLNSFFSGKFARTKISQFGRINYVFKDKYYLGLTGRNDGSSAFPTTKKWGFFPAVSAGWNISDESFMAGNPVVKYLKLRGSYGAAGNESFLANNIFYVNQYSSVWGTSYYIGGQQNTGVIQTQLANDNLKWETDITANVGLDFGFLNGRITGSFDFFIRTAKDLLDYAALPFNSSITSIAQNVGSTRSKGFDLDMVGAIVKKKDINWTVNFNISQSDVYWVERNPNVALNPWIGENDGVFDLYGWQTNGLLQSYAEVQSYKSNGIILQSGSFPGTPKYVDQNGDGKLDGLDVVNLGSSEPKFNYGLGTAFSYKGFDFNVQTYGFINRLMDDGWVGISNLRHVEEKFNQTVFVRDVWSSVNQSGTRVGIGMGTTESNNPSGKANYLMQKVNFMRLKNVTLGYTIPSSFLQRSNIARSIRFFVDIQNLAVLTNYVGLDPEMELNMSPFPIPRTTSMGINITF